MARKCMRALLGYLPPIMTPEWSLQNLTDVHFYKSPHTGSISFIVPSTGIPISNQHKTAAILRRGRAFLPVTAISGYSGSTYGEFSPPEAGFEKLNQAYWTGEALLLSKQIEFSFASHSYDKEGLAGSYHACHAEAQLMCYFVRRKYLFRSYTIVRKAEDDFLQLFLLQERSRKADILLSSQPCRSCMA